MKTSKLLTLILAAAAALTVLTGSIAAPILIRPFYYAQIGPLQLSARTGWSEEVIREAYDEVLDYCVLGREFGTGQLLWSESGRSHFADAAALFHLDFWVLGISAAVLLLCLAVKRRRGLTFWRPLGRGPGFWAGAGLAAVFAVVGALAATDFSRAFVLFHTLFFPGKDNWLFDYRTDQIILILPEEFFRNCALLIVALLLLCCLVLILWDLLRHRKRR